MTNLLQQFNILMYLCPGYVEPVAVAPRQSKQLAYGGSVEQEIRIRYAKYSTRASENFIYDGHFCNKKIKILTFMSNIFSSPEIQKHIHTEHLPARQID